MENCHGQQRVLPMPWTRRTKTLTGAYTNTAAAAERTRQKERRKPSNGPSTTFQFSPQSSLMARLGCAEVRETVSGLGPVAFWALKTAGRCLRLPGTTAGPTNTARLAEMKAGGGVPMQENTEKRPRRRDQVGRHQNETPCWCRRWQAARRSEDPGVRLN